MADDKNQKDILEIYSSLPDDLQDAIFAPETAKAIREIGKKYELTLDKVGILADITGSVMMGITPTSEFIKNIYEKVGVDREKAKTIAEDINHQIFTPVRESLKKVHGLGKLKSLSDKTARGDTITPPTPLNLRGEKEKDLNAPLKIRGDRGVMEIKKPTVAPPPSNLPIGSPIKPVEPAKPIPPRPPLSAPPAPSTKLVPPTPPPKLVPPPPIKPPAPLPSIFAKKIEIPLPPLISKNPEPPVNKIEPIKSSGVDAATLQAELEKALGGQIRRGTASPDIPPTASQNKKTDPYREPTN